MDSIQKNLQNNKINSEITINQVSDFENQAKHFANLKRAQNIEYHENNENIEKLKLQEEELSMNLQENSEKLIQMENQIEILKKYIEEYISQAEEPLLNDENILDRDTNVLNMMKRYFGFNIKLEPVNPNNWKIQFIFDENKYATLYINISEKTFNLQQLEPIHPNFDNIKEFLHNTSDISGFLYYARNYFLNCTTTK